GVERAVRIADRIQQMREREREGRQIRGELQPGMLPRPTGKPDPLVVAMRAAGEEVPAYLAAASDANEHGHVRLYSPVNSSNASPPPGGGGGGGGGGSPAGSEGEPGGGLSHGADSELASEVDADRLYFPVNSNPEPPPPGAAYAAPPSPEDGGGISG